MKKFLLLSFVLFSLFNTSTAQEPAFVPGQLIAQLEEGLSPFDVADRFRSVVDDFAYAAPLSDHMRLHLFSFEPGQMDTREVLRIFQGERGIRFAQLNHYVTDRATIPNDALYDNQWHHNQAGDHDIDTEEAWDITTGGYTAFGDRIVVCVIEGGGADWQHEDLIDTHWVNELEIPDNGMDDDGNGYVDDYDGWNPVNENDNIPSGNHGTAVSSMIGSTGNNEIGVAGVNWDVGIMQVTIGSIGGGGNPNEANVIAAYDYPLIMRKLYNESGGTEGAFVVATNASWGIDFGQPEDAPAWCAMYDSLGVQGVLNCGATANNNVNIDEVGDLPTGCGSDYMVSVTATNNNDVRTFSGYGIESVDLGAPGESVYLAESNDTYGNNTGTSFASPCVAGIIGLMYSTPCSSFMSLVQADPQAGANYILEALYAGVDPVDNLADEVATGGRANAFNSVSWLLNNCSETECLIPFSVNVQNTDINMYTVSWGSIPAMLSFNLQYRVVGDPDWILVEGLEENSYVLQDLLWCTEYEVQVSADCEEDSSDWSNSFVFTTDGCCTIPEASGIFEADADSSMIVLAWDFILAATSYEAEISPAGENNWTAFTGLIQPQNTFLDLETCTSYDFRIRANCDGELTDWSDVVTFTTQGCQDCTNLEYCEISGDGSEEWIANVSFNTIDNSTASDGGYGDYTNMTTSVAPGATYSISITPGYSDFQWSESFKVWIDFNGNEVFDAEELVFESAVPGTTTVTGDIEIPTGMDGGPATMRVSMDYETAGGGGTSPVECGELSFGEAEDYCVFVDYALNQTELKAFQAVNVYPNPANDVVFVEFNSNALPQQLRLLDGLGRVVHTEVPITSRVSLNTQHLTAGLYFVQTIGQDGEISLDKLVVER